MLSNGTSSCQCGQGWTGDRCERRIDYCQNVTCENNGVCRSRSSDYQCLCLAESSSGRHCEMIERKILILKVICRSISSIAIIVIVSSAMFIITMDVLKYIFGIDPVKKQRKVKKKIKRTHQMIIHYIYIDAPVMTSNDN